MAVRSIKGPCSYKTIAYVHTRQSKKTPFSVEIKVGVALRLRKTLLNHLAECAVHAGVPEVRIGSTPLQVQHVYVRTNEMMFIPVKVLDYVVKNKLPLLKSLCMPDFIGIEEPYSISGNGIVIALSGSKISSRVSFDTRKDHPIVVGPGSALNGNLRIGWGSIFGEDSVLSGNLSIKPQTVIYPGRRLELPLDMSRVSFPD